MLYLKNCGYSGVNQSKTSMIEWDSTSISPNLLVWYNISSKI